MSSSYRILIFIDCPFRLVRKGRDTQGEPCCHLRMRPVRKRAQQGKGTPPVSDKIHKTDSCGNGMCILCLIAHSDNRYYFFSRQRPAAAFSSLGIFPCAGAETLILKNRTVYWEIYSKPIEPCRTKKYRSPLKDCGMYENIYCSDLDGMKPVPLCGICSMAFPFRGRQCSIAACPLCGRQCIDYKA